MTLGIFAHANAGKTTITEQLLYHTNVAIFQHHQYQYCILFMFILLTTVKL